MKPGWREEEEEDVVSDMFMKGYSDNVASKRYRTIRG